MFTKAGRLEIKTVQSGGVMSCLLSPVSCPGVGLSVLVSHLPPPPTCVVINFMENEIGLFLKSRIFMMVSAVGPDNQSSHGEQN